ncbi:hypothetical protein RB653_005393 [Dictyostelium firmibasis]|uniref:PH domain-containing protein n=1 Tax=Dictyostelium firmibasis TaxID=79012 RepID=A0AAN7U7B7_9MYCE
MTGSTIGVPSSTSTTSISTSRNNDFLTLHKAYIDEWLMVSFLPILKTTYDGENNFYDISNLNIKNVNQRNIPFSEQLFALDRQFQNLINQWEKLSRNDQQRAAKIETYQQSFYSFIDRIKLTLEKTMVELGGSLEDSSFLAAAISLKEKQSKNKRLTIMARSRITSISPGSSTSYQHQMHLTGPISIVWNEILIIITRKVNEEIVKLQTENINNSVNNFNNSEFNISNDIYQFNNNNLTVTNKNEINNFRQKLNQQALSNIVPMIFEWRIMMANAQKVISEEKRFKVNPFLPTTVYDHGSSSFISSPILISTTNKTATTLLNNMNNNNGNINNNSNNNNNNNNNNSPISNSPSSSSSSPSPSPSPSSPTLTNRSHFINDYQNINDNIENNNTNNNSENKISDEINLSTSPPRTSGGMSNSTNNLPTIASPTSWTKAVKRPAMNSSGGNVPILNNLGTFPSNNKQDGNNINSINANSTFVNNNNNNNNNNNINNNISSNNVNSENNNIPTGGIIKQGWMKKRGTKNKSWKKRYFILDMKKTLRYYKDNKTQHGNNGIGSTNNSGPNGGSGNGGKGSDLLVNGNNISLPINSPHFSSTNSSIGNSSSSSTTNLLDNNDILSSFDHLKYKGSIDLYTSLVVAIKPSTCNVNINNSASFKEDNSSYFGMDIITPSRTWNLCCESSKSMDDWLIVLKSANK